MVDSYSAIVLRSRRQHGWLPLSFFAGEFFAGRDRRFSVSARASGACASSTSRLIPTAGGMNDCEILRGCRRCSTKRGRRVARQG